MSKKKTTGTDYSMRRQMSKAFEHHPVFLSHEAYGLVTYEKSDVQPCEWEIPNVLLSSDAVLALRKRFYLRQKLLLAIAEGNSVFAEKLTRDLCALLWSARGIPKPPMLPMGRRTRRNSR